MYYVARGRHEIGVWSFFMQTQNMGTSKKLKLQKKIDQEIQVKLVVINRHTVGHDTQVFWKDQTAKGRIT